MTNWLILGNSGIILNIDYYIFAFETFISLSILLTFDRNFQFKNWIALLNNNNNNNKCSYCTSTTRLQSLCPGVFFSIHLREQICFIILSYLSICILFFYKHLFWSVTNVFIFFNISLRPRILSKLNGKSNFSFFSCK